MYVSTSTNKNISEDVTLTEGSKCRLEVVVHYIPAVCVLVGIIEITEPKFVS